NKPPSIDLSLRTIPSGISVSLKSHGFHCDAISRRHRLAATSEMFLRSASEELWNPTGGSDVLRAFIL
ncbi:MAG: hypothetical protein ACRD4H_09520, partial [Candidatus Acidiferrales bacterium]